MVKMYGVYFFPGNQYNTIFKYIFVKSRKVNILNNRFSKTVLVITIHYPIRNIGSILYTVFTLALPSAPFSSKPAPQVISPASSVTRILQHSNYYIQIIIAYYSSCSSRLAFTSINNTAICSCTFYRPSFSWLHYHL